MIEPFSLSELGIFVGSCCASLSGFIYALSKSRCTTIKCCGLECERDVIQDAEHSDNIAVNSENNNI